MLKLKKDTAPEKLLKKTEYTVAKKTKADNFTFLNKNYCKKGQTVLVGDSITEIFNITELFDEYTARTKQTVYNRGISGDTSDRLLERIKDNVTMIMPSKIVLLIGTNDLGLGFSTDFTVNNTEKIIDILQTDCPDAKIILQSVYPVNNTMDRGMVGIRKNSDVKKINEKLRALSEKKGIVFADFYDMLCDEKGRFNKNFTYDGLHPNALGFEKVADKIINLLD